MNWAHAKLDHLLGWYSAQNVWVKVLCVLPVVLGIVVLLALCLGTLSLTPRRKHTTAEAIHSEAQTMIEGLDKELRKTKAVVREAQERQATITAKLEQEAAATSELRKQVSEMTHEELKAFMEEAGEQQAYNDYYVGEYTTEPMSERITQGLAVDAGKYGDTPKHPPHGGAGIPFNTLKSKIDKRGK
jgi:hypothetical protein